MDSVAVLTSLALQYGVKLEDLVRKFRGVHFEPAGLTDNPDLPAAASLVDYVFRWLEVRFLEQGRGSRVAGRGRGKAAKDALTGLACPECGSELIVAEGCLICRGCGYTKCG